MSDPFGGRSYEVSFSREGVWLRYPPDLRWWRGSSLADAIADEKYALAHQKARARVVPAPAIGPTEIGGGAR